MIDSMLPCRPGAAHSNEAHLVDHAAQESSALLGGQLGECPTKDKLGYDQLVTRVDFAGDAAFQLYHSLRIAVTESPEHTLPPPHLRMYGAYRGKDSNTKKAKVSSASVQCDDMKTKNNISVNKALWHPAMINEIYRMHELGSSDYADCRAGSLLAALQLAHEIC